METNQIAIVIGGVAVLVLLLWGLFKCVKADSDD